MVEENKKMLKVENEVLKKTTAPGSSQAVSRPSTIQGKRCLTSVIRREGVCSSWYGRRHDSPFCGCYGFATFLPICKESLGYGCVLCDGKGSSEWLKKIKSC